MPFSPNSDYMKSEEPQKYLVCDGVNLGMVTVASDFPKEKNLPKIINGLIPVTKVC
jgi:hypothetical protein